MSPRLIDSEGGLRALAGELRDAPRVHLDTEFESRREGTTLSIVQLAAGSTVWLVDALRLRSLTELAPALAGKEWVVHAGRQDVELLVGALGFGEPPPLFDTQVAWALSSAEWQVSLAYLEYRILGTRKMKTHQQDDWMRRPLPASQLEYAASDVLDLPVLREALLRRVTELGRSLEAVHEASREVAWPAPAPLRPVSMASFRGAWQLDPPSQAALRFLIERADIAALSLQPKVVLSIASRHPHTGRDLARIKGVPRSWAEREGDAFCRELRRATEHHDAAEFVPIEPEPYATFDDLRVEGLLAHLRAEVCAEARVAPELAFPPALIRRMKDRILGSGERTCAHAEDELSGWRESLKDPWRKAHAAACAGR